MKLKELAYYLSSIQRKISTVEVLTVEARKMELILSLTTIDALCVIPTIIETLICTTLSSAHRLTHTTNAIALNKYQYSQMWSNHIAKRY